MLFEYGGKQYEALVGTDLDRQGWVMFAWDLTGGGPIFIEAFRPNDGSGIAISTHVENIPLAVVEWFIRQLHEELGDHRFNRDAEC